jgi:hypothetical protein
MLMANTNLLALVAVVLLVVTIDGFAPLQLGPQTVAEENNARINRLVNQIRGSGFQL